MQAELMNWSSLKRRRLLAWKEPRSHAILGAIPLLILGACLLSFGCAPPTVWRAEVRSPDGHYIAIARTIQNGGFGSAGISTVVSVKPTVFSNPPTEVLEFSCKGPVPRPYTLDNNANAGGTINLAMKWLTPTHLEVSYDGSNGTLEFQAVRYQGIEISLRDLASNATNLSSKR